MIDDIYKKSFKEVYDILKNTDKELLAKIPTKFINFIKNNMDVNYQTNIKTDLQIDKQKLMKETESILSLIYRSYWATDKEKREFASKDQQEFFEIEEKKKAEYIGKDIYQIFEERKNINQITIDNNLMVVEEKSVFRKFLEKILGIFKK